MSRLWVLMLAMLIVLAACTRQETTPVTPEPGDFAAQAASELFFSEYVEGSSNNKALEIYNGTESTIDLTTGGYNVQMFYNGSATAGLTINLTGTVAVGDVFVLAQSSASATILAQADKTNGAGWFNGNDAVVLRKGTTVIDSIGQIGFDPGSQWGSDPASTADNTLRRKTSVCAGDVNPSDVFDPITEWDGLATDTFDGLGAHTTSCDAMPEPGTPMLVINEIDYDQASTDAAEFIEIKNAGTTAVNLDPYEVRLINGSNGGNAVYLTIDLPDTSLAAADYFVVCANASTTPNCDLDVAPDTNLIQNGAPDAAAIVLNGEIVDTLSYEGEVPDYTEDTGAPADTDGDNVGLSRLPDGTDTNNNSTDFSLRCITPGETNAEGSSNCPTPGNGGGGEGGEMGQCTDPATFIHDIQGSDVASPLDGQTVTIEGVVVGDFQENDGDTFNTDLDGYYVQEEEGDYDTNTETSEGIFVFAPGATNVSVGDVVRVKGTVDEFFGLTELTDVTDFLACGSTTPPDPFELELPLTNDELERYEGMLVTFPQDLVISEYFNFGRYNEIMLALPNPDDEDRQYTPTSFVEPDDAADEALENELKRILLDDGRSAQNPDPARHPDGNVFDLGNLFRGGDLVTNATGVLSYSFDEYRIQPTTGADYTQTNERPSAPEGGNLTVASFNVLNYFTTLGSRGADNQEEFERQRAKIVAALSAIDADIVGLIEIENNTQAIQDLVGALNNEMGAGTYDYIDTGTIGTDEIKVAFIYKPATVAPVGEYAVLDDPAFTNPRDDSTPKNRPALAQTFEQKSDGAMFTAVVNHLKSKGSGCGPGDDDPFQGNCNLTRTLAAQELVDWLAEDPTDSGDPDILILGDLNAYDEEDPIELLKVNGFTDLLEEFVGEFAYTYVFDGQFGHLDYALTNGTLLEQVTSAAAWHINADEPSILDYDLSFKRDAQDVLYQVNPYRSSDHDPVVVGLDLSAAPVCSKAKPSVASIWPPNHQMVNVTVLGVTDPEGEAVTIEITSIYQDESVDLPGEGDGSFAPDGAGVGTSTAQVRAERIGGGNGRVYHVGFTATNTFGQNCTGEVLVTVPKSQGRNGSAVDDGALFDSTQLP